MTQNYDPIYPELQREEANVNSTTEPTQVSMGFFRDWKRDLDLKPHSHLQYAQNMLFVGAFAPVVGFAGANTMKQFNYWAAFFPKGNNVNLFFDKMFFRVGLGMGVASFALFNLCYADRSAAALRYSIVSAGAAIESYRFKLSEYFTLDRKLSLLKSMLYTITAFGIYECTKNPSPYSLLLGSSFAVEVMFLSQILFK